MIRAEEQEGGQRHRALLNTAHAGLVLPLAVADDSLEKDRAAPICAYASLLRKEDGIIGIQDKEKEGWREGRKREPYSQCFSSTSPEEHSLPLLRSQAPCTQSNTIQSLTNN